MKTTTEKTTKADQEIAVSSLPGLSAAIFSGKSDEVKIKIHEGGDFVIIPRKALHLLLNILSNMAEGKAVSVVSSDSAVSTRQAADLLHVSRPHLVKLLEEGIIPFTKVGSHRRVMLKDLIEFEKLKNQRRKSLDYLAQQAQTLHLGYE